MRPSNRSPWRCRGLTMIELMIAVAIGAILLTVAVGGFGGTFSRKRAEGVALGLVSDLQLARTEAVSRNNAVRLTLGTGCYIVHTQTPNTSTSCNGADPPSLGTGARLIKLVQLGGNDVTFARQPTATPPAYFEFSQVNGWLDTGIAGVLNPGALIGSTNGSWQLRVQVQNTGRVRLCSPSSTMPGYEACS